MSDAKKNAIKEKFILQKQTIEKQAARISELERMLIPPTVKEIATQYNYEEPKKILSFVQNDIISIQPDPLMPIDKVKELESITSQLQEELRQSHTENENLQTAKQKEINSLTKKISQLESSNSSLNKEIEQHTEAQVHYKAEIAKLNADLIEKQATLKRLQDNQRKLTLENADLDQAQQLQTSLSHQIEELKQEKNTLETELSKMKQKLLDQQKIHKQTEDKLKSELSLLSEKISQLNNRGKEAEEKIQSSETNTRRSYQKIAELESTIDSLQTRNEELTNTTVKLMKEMQQMKQKESESNTSSQELNTLKKQILNLRKEDQRTKEKYKSLEQRAEIAERKAESLSKDLKKMTETLSNTMAGTASVDEAVTKMNEMKSELRLNQKECSDLKIQLAHTKSLKNDIQESNKKLANLQRNIDVMQAKIDYIKQVVIQLLTAPFSQRQRVIDVLVDLLAFSSKEKEMVNSSLANGTSITSRILYAFDPFV